jgi:hypothetical protein
MSDLNDSMIHGSNDVVELSEAELDAVQGGFLGLGKIKEGLEKVAGGIAAGVGVVAAIVSAPATVPAGVLLGIGIVGGLAAGVLVGGGASDMFPEDELPGPGYDVGPYEEDYNIR